MGFFTDSKGHTTGYVNDKGLYGREIWSYDGRIDGDTIISKYGGTVEGTIDRDTGKVYDRYGKFTGEYYED